MYTREIVIFLTLHLIHVNGLPSRKRSFPICSSYDSLCDVTVDFSSSKLPTEPICRCPGKITCAQAKKDPRRTLVMDSGSISGEKVTSTFTYCNMQTFTWRKCKKNEPVAKIREFGPMEFKAFGDIRCICREPLVLRKSVAVPNSKASLGTYTCGMPTCDINQVNEPVCARMTSGEAGLLSEFPCQCPTEYQCLIDDSRVPDSIGGSAEFFCQRNPSNFY